VPRLCEVYTGICLTTDEKAWKTLSQGSRRMPVGKEYTEQSILVSFILLDPYITEDYFTIEVLDNSLIYFRARCRIARIVVSIGPGIEEEGSEVLHLEHSFIWC